MSELELSILRQRSLEALKQKARRGELFLTVAIGYVKVRHNRIEKDPDSQIREAIDLVFRKFSEFQSIGRRISGCGGSDFEPPAVEYTAVDGRRIRRKSPGLQHGPPNSRPIRSMAGPMPSGAPAAAITIEDGRKRIARGFRRERTNGKSCSPATTKDISHGRSPRGISA